MNTYSSVEIIKLLEQEGFKVSPRTFTYYATEKKLLPSPVLINKKAKYTDKHIYYLKALIILKEKGSTLEEIKKELDCLNEEEIQLISFMYKPFNSKELVQDTRNLYQTYSSSNDSQSSECEDKTYSFLNNLIANSSSQQNASVVDNQLIGSSLNAQDVSLQSFANTVYSENFRAMTSINGVSSLLNSANSLNSSKVINNTTTSVSSTTPIIKSQRTIVNEKIILETKNLKQECLQEIIKEIDKIYNKYEGDVF